MELAELLARIEAATGPDRELDGLLLCATAKGLSLGKNQLGGTIVQHVDGMRWCLDDAAPKYTESVDAALALVERVLPGWFWSIGFIDEEAATQEHHKHGAVVHPHWHVADKHDGLGHGATPPLAILAAMVRALLAKEA